MSPVLIFAQSREALNPSWWLLLLVTSTNFETSKKFLQKNMYLIACTSPLYQNHIYTVLPSCLLRAVSQSFLRCCLPGCNPCFAPQ